MKPLVVIEFGGWDMPVRYRQTIRAEHEAVRTGAGIFDVSHMGEIEITGEHALTAMNRLITNDLERIADGRALYTAMCLPTGGIVDDLVVYRFSTSRFSFAAMRLIERKTLRGLKRT